MDCLSLSSSVSISKTVNLVGVSKKQQRAGNHGFGVSCRVEENLYKILSLSPKSATKDNIKRAYRSMALRYHPDVCHDGSKKEKESMFVKLNAAYTTLSNPTLRAEYDYELGLRSQKSRWQEQLAELKRRSQNRMTQKERSCSCSCSCSCARMQNINS